jgi:hypothetical protein
VHLIVASLKLSKTRLSSATEPNDRSAFGAVLFMDATTNTAKDNPPGPHFVKTNIPNLIKMQPMGTYYGRGQGSWQARKGTVEN